MDMLRRLISCRIIIIIIIIIIGRPSKQRRVVLRRRNTVVGGKCALPSALPVTFRFESHKKTSDMMCYPPVRWRTVGQNAGQFAISGVVGCHGYAGALVGVT